MWLSLCATGPEITSVGAAPSGGPEYKHILLSVTAVLELQTLP